MDGGAVAAIVMSALLAVGSVGLVMHHHWSAHHRATAYGQHGAGDVAVRYRAS